MPLRTQIVRGSKPLKVPSWDGQMLSFMYTAAFKEAEPEREYADGETFGDLGQAQVEETGEYFDQWVDFSMAPIYYLGGESPLMKRGEQTLLQNHRFLHTDHKGKQTIVELKPGDVLRAWRE